MKSDPARPARRTPPARRGGRTPAERGGTGGALNWFAPGASWPRAVGLGAGLVVLTLVVYGSVLGHPFVDWDDLQSIARNPDYNPPALARLGHYWTDVWTGHLNFYAPVLYTVWGLTAMVARDPAAAAGFDPAPFHALNLLSHAANGLLVFVVLRRLVRGDWPAWVGAALFVVHPLQAEPVAWASTVYTPLSVTFALVAAWQYLVFSDAGEGAGGLESLRPSPRRWVHYGVATAAFVVALLTKPSVMMTPVILGLIEVPLRRRRFLPTTLLLGVWLVPAVLIGWVTARYTQPAAFTFHPAPPQRLLVAADAVGFYLYKLVLPFGLVADYGRSPQWALGRGTVWLTAAVPVLLAAGCLAAWRRARWPAVALAAFVLGMFATLGLVPFDYQRYSTVADRYAYFALFGPALGLAYAAARPARRKEFYPVTGVVLAVLAAVSMVQCSYWKDTVTLFDHNLRVNPASAAGHRFCMAERDRQGQLGEAMGHCEAALALQPGDPVVLNFKGYLLTRQGRYDEAAGVYRRSLGTKPDDAVVYDNLGAALARGGRLDEAAPAFAEALRRDPSLAAAHEHLGILFAQRGDWAAALPYLREAVRLDPASVQARQGLGMAEAGAAKNRPPATKPAGR